MNDIMTVIILLSKTTHDYTKRTIQMNGGDELVKITLSNGIDFNFTKDGAIDYITHNKKI